MSHLPEIQYGARAGHSGGLIIDYDASRLHLLQGVKSRCGELSDLVEDGAGPFNSIAMTVFPYTGKPQLTRDFLAAAKLLKSTGTMMVRLSEPRVSASIRRELAQHFAEVESPDKLTIFCRRPRLDLAESLNEDIEIFNYFDPAAQRELQFATRPGMFSVGSLDLGTRLLLDVLAEEADLPSAPKLLDIGCGYGAIGCVTAARGAQVTMIDSDWRAIKLARANLTANGLSGIVEVGDAAVALPVGQFDLIVSNPPTHAGSAPLQRIFDLAANAGNSVRIVVRAHLNYEKWLNESYHVHRVAERDGYKVIAFRRHRSGQARN